MRTRLNPFTMKEKRGRHTIHKHWQDDDVTTEEDGDRNIWYLRVFWFCHKEDMNFEITDRTPNCTSFTSCIQTTWIIHLKYRNIKRYTIYFLNPFWPLKIWKFFAFLVNKVNFKFSSWLCNTSFPSFTRWDSRPKVFGRVDWKGRGLTWTVSWSSTSLR